MAFLPLGLGFAGASLYGRRLAARHGSAVLLWGAGAMALGYVLLVVTLLPGPVPSRAGQALAMAPALLVAGVGQGLVGSPLLGAILATVPATEAGAASGAVLTVNQLASSLGVAGLGALFVAFLGGDPQDPAKGHGVGDFTAALSGCAWALLALAAATALLVRRLPAPARPPGG